MKPKNKFLIIAGLLNLGVFFLHLIGGQIDLVDPMLETALSLEEKSQLIGAWHLVTISLLATSYVLLSAGWGQCYAQNVDLIKLTGFLNLSFCLPFLGTSMYYHLFVPQWILFLPIGLLTLFGIKKGNKPLT
ncbi:MAG: hypothetical protein AAGJ18_24055 [Bacteroidota bacterium]